MQETLNKHWHMAQTDFEIEHTEFEFSLIRAAAAFERWRSDCSACCFDRSLSGADVAVLNVIRMHDRPKSISEIARLLNRDDLSNIQYGIRKLVAAKVVEKNGKGRSKKGVRYFVTEYGYELTDNYAQLRRELVIRMSKALTTNVSLAEAAKVLNLMSGMYDQASRIAAAHRPAD